MLNENFERLSSSYLFKEIENRCKELKKTNKDIVLINLGIGDSFFPIPKIIAKEIYKAAKKLSTKNGFKGYLNAQGELFLRKKILENDYKNVNISEDEIFISSGTKHNISAIQELFSKEAKIGILDPTYPVYLDSNILAGKTNISFINCNEENNFTPSPPDFHLDAIYLCSPNNPTGAFFSKEKLQQWVDYALKEHCIILFDGAYEAFVQNGIKTIYEIENADKVAIEFRSFSKTASFSSVRLSYCTIPKNLKIYNNSLHLMWKRIIDAKFGAVSYPIQKAGALIYHKKIQKQIKKQVSYFLKNAKTLKKGLQKLGLKVFGATNSPYIWCKTPSNMNSLEFFDLLLQKANVITTFGDGFGENGKNFIRFSSFAKKTDIKKALKKIRKIKSFL